MTILRSSNLGYPRIGENREWKKALEAFWAGKLEESELLTQLKSIRLKHLQVQKDAGIDLIPVNDFSLYDHILDTATMFGVVPARFGYLGSGPVPVSVYYAIARGNKEASASEMTKWFNTNYHYIVPELNGAAPKLVENRPLNAYREAKQELGIEGKPVIVGPYTFLKLSKGYEPSQFAALVDQFLPLYAQVLQELEAEGVKWVQIDEPSLVASVSEEELKLVQSIYAWLNQAAPNLNLLLQTYFESVEQYEAVVTLPVQGIGLDFTIGDRSLKQLEALGFPANKVLAAGVVDGRNIWRADLRDKTALVNRIAAVVPQERLIVQPSCSLLHVPVSAKGEVGLAAELSDALAFANEKLEEIVVIARAVREGEAAVQDQLDNNDAVLRTLNESASRNRKSVQDAVAEIGKQSSSRKSVFASRNAAQKARWNLPFLPTTTIGSFPQTADVRAARQQWRKGQLQDEPYKAFIREHIAKWIKLQEEIGLDVLVHGEFERTDMVEFFGEKLDGFAFTRNGWVQSYGSRCVKPPIIYGDVQFSQPMTVEETVYAQSLTSKPVKGMLTGPITILNWSFVRSDITREQVAYQIALALAEEVKALESAGIEMIQVDEPALREGLPLKRADWEHYLNWAVLAFRLSTSDVADTTQIHTHMCYCEFHDIIDSIRALDADVISIETSRSHGELIHSFEEHTYDLGIGLGVYDIHSPRVPAVAEMTNMIGRALKVLDPELFWINPDCGLKTRGIDETVASLRTMIEATEIVRSQFEQAKAGV